MTVQDIPDEVEAAEAFSEDPNDTVREYAPDAVRRTAAQLSDRPGWGVRDDGAFDVHGPDGGRWVVERDGAVRGDDSEEMRVPIEFDGRKVEVQVLRRTEETGPLLRLMGINCQLDGDGPGDYYLSDPD